MAKDLEFQADDQIGLLRGNQEGYGTSASLSSLLGVAAIDFSNLTAAQVGDLQNAVFGPIGNAGDVWQVNADGATFGWGPAATYYSVLGLAAGATPPTMFVGATLIDDVSDPLLVYIYDMNDGVYRPQEAGAPPAAPVTEDFFATGADQQFVVPAGVTSIDFDASGADGGISFISTITGKGGRVRGTLPVTPEETLTLVVSAQGHASPANGQPGAAAYFNGSTAGSSESTTRSGSGGGGVVGIFRGAVTLANALVIAGSGGGSFRTAGGDGGGLIGGDGVPDPARPQTAHGLGGTQTAGGAGGDSPLGLDGLAGGALIGGNSQSSVAGNAGGTGGAGYYGGGSGSSDDVAGGAPTAEGAGGGGSSFTDATVTSVIHEQGGSITGGDGQISLTY